MRLFIALELPETVRAQAVAVSESLKCRDFRVVRPESMHITLKFLGKCDDLGAIAAAAAPAVACHRCFQVDVRGGGQFPTKGPARVLWAGVHGPLAPLSTALDEALAPLGHEPEDRAFHGHVTLARSRGRRSAKAPEALAGIGRLGRFIATELVVFESQLHRDGARYTARARLPLSPSPE